MQHECDRRLTDRPGYGKMGSYMLNRLRWYDSA